MSYPDNDSVNRQIQINEWQYYNKMDTVFVMQLTFIGISIAAVVFYFLNTGAIGRTFAYYVVGITAILVTTITINRVFFTSARRDPKYWHRFRFNEDGKKVPNIINNPTFGDFWAAFMGQQKLAVKSSCPACPEATVAAANTAEGALAGGSAGSQPTS